MSKTIWLGLSRKRYVRIADARARLFGSSRLHRCLNCLLPTTFNKNQSYCDDYFFFHTTKDFEERRKRSAK